MRIALTGGGSGGHLFPMIAVAQGIKNLVQQNIFQIPPGEGISVDFMFIGPQTVGEETLTENNIPHKRIQAGKFRRYFSFQNVIDVFRVPIGFLQSLWHLFFFMPNAIFSKGGFGSVPVVLAAWIYRIPVLIHESDSIPGLANKFCAKFSKRIAISFSEAANYFPAKKIALTGNPIRPGLANGTKERAKELFGLSGTKPVILILGGSQGATALNDIIFASLPRLLENCEVIHQCGPGNYETIKQMLSQKIPEGYFLLPFLNEDQLCQAYAAADLVISRAGAGSITEIAYLAKPSIIVPLPNSAGDHQLKNALEYVAYGGSIVIEQMNLTPNLFENRVSALLQDPASLKKMSENAKRFAQEDAVPRIAQELLNIAKY